MIRPHDTGAQYQPAALMDPTRPRFSRPRSNGWRPNFFQKAATKISGRSDCFWKVFYKWTLLKHILDLKSLKNARLTGALIVPRGDKGFYVFPSRQNMSKYKGAKTIDAVIIVDALILNMIYNI
jgi:hypothetical protein